MVRTGPRRHHARESRSRPRGTWANQRETSTGLVRHCSSNPDSLTLQTIGNRRPEQIPFDQRLSPKWQLEGKPARDFGRVGDLANVGPGLLVIGDDQLVDAS